MPNTSISFPASPAVNQQYTYGTTTYVYTGTNWAVYVSSASLPSFVTSANIVDGTIVNADINASAAIDGSKISPVFTSASTFSSTLGVTGNLAVNTNKFTVAASSGNTLAAGTLDVTGATTLSSTLGVTGNLAVNTNKFTVAASSGNTLAAGTLTATGGVVATSLTSKIQPITASVAASAPYNLTITLNPTILDFRSSTLTNGTVTSLVVANAISLTIPSTSTMGTVNAQPSRIVVLAINNAGTVELAAVNIAGGSPLDETTLITTTAAVAAGNSATAYYSTIARTSVAYRVVGYVESTQATAGTWATTPTTIQGMGGQALTAMSSLGYGQTWQTVTRSSGTTYYNTTGKTIGFIATVSDGFTSNSMAIQINGVQIGNTSYNGTSGTSSLFAIIPPNNSYSYVYGGVTTSSLVKELR